MGALKEEEPEYLKLAANQYYIGSMAMIASGPGDKAEIGRRLRQLRNAAGAVHDLGSFRQYINLENQGAAQEQKVEVAGLIEPDKNAKSFGELYLVLYLIGSVVALIGQALDWYSEQTQLR